MPDNKIFTGTGYTDTQEKAQAYDRIVQMLQNKQWDSESELVTQLRSVAFPHSS